MKSLSHVRLFATPWTVASQTPLYMEFSRQEYWSGLPFPSPVCYMHVCIYIYTHIYIYHIFIHSVDGHLGCSYVLTIVNNAL